MERTIKTATYTPSAERTDDWDYVVGDVTVITFNECDHTAPAAPHVHYSPGERFKCRRCDNTSEALRRLSRGTVV